MGSTAEVTGEVEAGFEPVREAFERNFAEHGDVGASFCAYHRGRKVVELWGGTNGELPYAPGTLQLVFSTTKGATALCAHRLVERGELDLDAPVTDHWPEFGAHGKDRVPVRWLLSHQVGLPDVDREMTFEQALDWGNVTAALADSVPIWEPGTQHGYHAITYGYLVGELVRRVSGRSLGAFFAEEVAEPLGLDFWIGTPEEQHHRLARLLPMDPPAGIVPPGPEGPTHETGIGDAAPVDLIALLEQFMPGSLIGRALCAPGGAFRNHEVWNHPDLWRAEVPAAGGIADAPSIARMYAACIGEVDGVRLLSPEAVEVARTPQVSGPDSVLFFAIPFGLGFMTHSDFSPLGGPGGFGHYGAGGSLGFAHPEAELAGAYVMNKMQVGIAGDPRTQGLLSALEACVR